MIVSKLGRKCEAYTCISVCYSNNSVTAATFWFLGQQNRAKPRVCHNKLSHLVAVALSWGRYLKKGIFKWSECDQNIRSTYTSGPLIREGYLLNSSSWIRKTLEAFHKTRKVRTNGSPKQKKKKIFYTYIYMIYLESCHYAYIETLSRC